MKFFLISILNSLGFGTNGVIISPTHFASRIEGVANGCKVTPIDNNHFHVECADGSAFNLNYTTDGRRILHVEID